MAKWDICWNMKLIYCTLTQFKNTKVLFGEEQQQQQQKDPSHELSLQY
jgi:hypothetical protein